MKNCIIGAFLLLPLSLLAQVKKADNQIIPLDSAVRTGKLPNGFTYYIRHNEEPKNRVIFYLANKVGSVLEDEDQRGLAHFTEHMSFNGTKNFPKNELVNYLQKSGVRFGADLNAYTGFDETVYQLPLPTNDPQIIKNGIQIMRDWAQNATLDAGEIDKERGVILEEKRLGKGAGERLQRQYWPVLFNNSRYAVRVPIGIDQVLNNFKPEAIRRFYHDWYRPDLQALIVVGDIDVNQMERTIRAKFGDLKNPRQQKARPIYKIPLKGENDFIAVTDKELTSTSAEVIIKHKALPLKTISEYRNAVIIQLFNMMLSQRFTELSRQANPPFIDGSGGIKGILGDLSGFSVSVTARPGELEQGVKAAWAEVERVKIYGFAPTELERVKTNILNYLKSVLSEKQKTNSDSYVKELLSYFLKGEAAPGIDAEYKLLSSVLPGINESDINELILSYITSTNRYIIVTAPEKDKIVLPNETEFISWMKTVEQQKYTSYQDKVNSGSLIKTQPVSGKIKSEQKNEKLGITTIILSNGVKVVLKPTDFKNNQILFSSFAPGGTSLYYDADYQSAASAATVIPAAGIGNYTKNELENFLSGKQAGVAPYITEKFQGINGGCSNEYFETAMQLTYAYFTEPRRDESIFDGLIVQSKAAIANRSNNPDNVFLDSAKALMGRNSIRYTGLSFEKIDQINLDKAYKIYKERFADAANFTFVFTGSFNVMEIKPLLEKYLGGLPSTYQNEQAKDLHITPPEGKITKIIYKGMEPKATVELIFTGSYDYSFENNLQLNALKEILQIRLLERLRENESGAYSPVININATKFPRGRFGLVVHFGCAPQNADKLIASTIDEIDKLKNKGPQQINLDKFKAEDRLTRETQIKTNTFWLGYINSKLQNKEDMGKDIDDYPEAINKVTIRSVQETAQKYLDAKNFIKLELLPEPVKP